MSEARHLTWEVDHEARMIILTVRLAVYKESGKKPTAKEVQQVLECTEEPWIGHHFACYQLFIIVKVRAIDKGEAGDDEMPVQIDWPHSSIVMVKDPEGQDGLGDQPEHRPEVIEGKFNPKQTHAWGHELGHILGLGDGYDNTDGRPRTPGHPDDLMFDENNGRPSPETIARLVRRGGEVDESKMRCSMTFDAFPGTLNLLIAEVKDLSVHAWACEWRPPSTNSSEPPIPIKFQGYLRFDVGVLHGGQNAGFRTFIELATGVNTDPLAPMYDGSIPITFSIAPSGAGTFSLGPEGIVVEGDYTWELDDMALGTPIVKGPLRVNGISTASFMPGPPIHAAFTKDAPECSP